MNVENKLNKRSNTLRVTLALSLNNFEESCLMKPWVNLDNDTLYYYSLYEILFSKDIRSTRRAPFNWKKVASLSISFRFSQPDLLLLLLPQGLIQEYHYYRRLLRSWKRIPNSKSNTFFCIKLHEPTYRCRFQ